MENMEKLEFGTHVCGGGHNYNPHIWGYCTLHTDFESVGCEFESRRGRLYVAVNPVNTPIYWGIKPGFCQAFCFCCSSGAVGFIRLML